MSIKELESPVAVDFTADFTETNQEHSPLIDQLSEPIIGKWNVLVSQTNWEKGALILSWRNELLAAGLPNTAYSDEAWGRRVGNVSSQHIGRLRRVAEKFGDSYQNFPNLYWSHFSAALDWDDSELWLEGAVQNGWSVAQMRVQRSDTFAPGEQKPSDNDIVIADFDDEGYSREGLTQQPLPERIEGRTVTIGEPDVVEGFDASSIPITDGAEPSTKKQQTKKDKANTGGSGERDFQNAPKAGDILMSLREISEYPADLADSLELLKVAVLNHKLSGWKSISADRVCRSLEALKMLTTAAD